MKAKYLKKFSLGRLLSPGRLAQWAFYLFFAFLPFQIDAMVMGGNLNAGVFLNPYLSHFVYASDIFLILSLFFVGVDAVVTGGGFLAKLKFGKAGGAAGRRWIFWGVAAIFFMNVFSLIFSADVANTLFYCVRILEWGIVYLLLAGGFVDVKKIIYVFVGVVSFTALIGIFQYVFQESLGLRFLGEPIISSDKAGVAKVDLFDGTVLRAYGTFFHPNVFAAYITFAIFFVIDFFRRSKILCAFVLAILVFALILTFSRSALFAFALAMMFYFAFSNMRLYAKYVIAAFLFVVLLTIVFDLLPVIIERFSLSDSSNLAERGIYLAISKHMFFENIFGVGAGNFTAVMRSYADVSLEPWMYQPVHNMFLLLLNEIGIQGLLFFLAWFLYLPYAAFRRMKKMTVESDKKFVIVLMALWVFILAVGQMDHYFISLYQGQALLWFWGGLTAYSCSRL
ncbi:MAG: O-antigen ligase family protein [Candidatus Peregrinibacteria bacterium]